MRAFLKDRTGQVLIISALLLPVMIGIGAFAIDLSSFYVDKSKLQTAADAAALGAVLSLSDQPASIKAALDLAQKNVPQNFGTVINTEDVVFGTYDSSKKTFTPTSVSPNAVEITVARESARGNASQTFLGQIWGKKAVDISATAIAVSLSSTPCVIALDPAAKNAFHVTGAGTVSIPKCAIYINSSDALALRQGGSGWIKAKSTQVVGGYYSAGHYAPVPLGKQPVIPDPLAKILEPVMPSGCTYRDHKFSTAAKIPGGSVYCGKIDFSTQIIFGSGIHYFKGAAVTTTSASSLKGVETMLFLMTPARLMPVPPVLFQSNRRSPVFMRASPYLVLGRARYRR